MTHSYPQPRTHHPSRSLILLCALVLLLLAPAKIVRGDAPLEDRVKCAFIVNFIQFIDWPDGTFTKADDPIVIGVLDQDPIEAALAAATEGKTVKGRKLAVRHFAPDAVGACQVLYLGNSAKSPEILKSLAGKSVLTIGDADNFTDVGGIIRFYLEDRKERFEINQAAAERAKLEISSKLLKLAKIVNK